MTNEHVQNSELHLDPEHKLESNTWVILEIKHRIGQASTIHEFQTKTLMEAESITKSQAKICDLPKGYYVKLMKT